MLLDLEMPVLAGYGVLQGLAERTGAGRSAVIVVTGSRAATPPGAAACLRKPVSLEDLMAEVARHAVARPAIR